MLVLDPLPVVIEGAEEMEVDVPFSPKVPTMGSHKVKFTPTVYIDRSDFREVDSKDYFRLAPGKTVGLLQVPYPIKAVSFSKDETTGKVTEVRAVFDKEAKKPKTYIQWVASDSREVEVRIHNSLFKSERPDDAEGGYLNDLNPDSEVIHPAARIESAGFDEVRRRAPWPEAAGESELGKGGPESVRFQAMRIAYFVSFPCPPWMKCSHHNLSPLGVFITNFMSRGSSKYIANTCTRRRWTRTPQRTRWCSTRS